MIEAFAPLALLSALGVELLADVSSKWIASRWKAAGITNHDLQKALREAYCDALSSIEFGFGQNIGLVGITGKKRIYEEVTRDFDSEFLTPFFKVKNLSENDIAIFLREGDKYCNILSRAVDKVLPKEEISNITIEDLLLTGRKLEGAEDLRRLNENAKSDLISRIQKACEIPDMFIEFLEYKDLLNWSITFFYGEKIKANERVRSILTHNELLRIREEQSSLVEEKSQRLQQALQTEMAGISRFIRPINDNLAEVLSYLERLESKWEETTIYLKRIMDVISTDKVLSQKERDQLQASISPSFDLHTKYEYDANRPVGYGSIATVYRALHRGLKQERALKILRPEHKGNEEIVERFLREAIVMGELKHPNIIKIFDAGGGGPNLDFYLEMEYVDGVTLRNFIKTHEYDPARVLKFIKQLGSAIQTIHENGIIHRDLNPRNIMVDKNGNLKVMDFGVAKLTGIEGLTRAGQVIGTGDYMAPEQARGERVDERADIYSFGVVVYEMCTRRFPSMPPLPMRQYELRVPEWLEPVISRCLAPSREQRYANMKDVLTAFNDAEEKARPRIMCKYHPEAEAVGNCASCSQALCSDCAVIVKDKRYCRQCYLRLIEPGKSGTTTIRIKPVKRRTPFIISIKQYWKWPALAVTLIGVVLVIVLFVPEISRTFLVSSPSTPALIMVPPTTSQVETTPAESATPAILKPVELNMLAAWPKTIILQKRYIDWFINNINTQGGNVKLSIKYDGGPEIVPSDEQVDAVGKGSFDIVFTEISLHEKLAMEAGAIRHSQLQPWEEKENGSFDILNSIFGKKANVHYLMRVAQYGANQVYLNVYHKETSLTGLNISCAPFSLMDMAWIENVKATAISMDITGVYNALEKGAINGYIAGPGINNWKLDKITRYIWGPSFGNGGFTVFINLDKWKSLHEDQRNFLTKLAAKLEYDTEMIWNEDYKLLRENLLQAGLQQIQFSPAEEKKYLDTGYEASWNALIEKSPEFAEFKKLMKK